MRSLVLAACLLLPCSVAAAGEPEPARIGLEGVAAVVTQPTGTWDQVTDAPAAGQWYLEYTDPDGEALMRAHVFPVRGDKVPEKVLMQAVDVFFRGLGVDGFGLPTRRTLDIWGCAAAEGTLAAVVGGQAVRGRARLMLADDAHWAFAIGYATARAAKQKQDAVHLFAGSLEPQEPQFYARTFHRPADHSVVAVQKPDEEPVTVGQLAAAEALLEAGIGARFPLGLKPTVRGAILADAKDGEAQTRLGYRDAETLLKKVTGQAPELRDAAMKAFGRRILQAILQRAATQYPPAIRFAVAWREYRLLSIGDREDGLTSGHIANGIEMSEFLASVAADHEVVADAATRERLHGRLKASWDGRSPEERKARREWGAVWAALRYAWDTADEAWRLAFRAAVAVRLSAPGAGPAPLGGSPDPRALMRWMEARARDGLDARCLDAAFDLSPAEIRALIGVLRVEDPYGFHFGW